MKFKSPVLLSVLLSTISLLLLNPHFSPFSALSFASTSTNASTSASSLTYCLHLPLLMLLPQPLLWLIVCIYLNLWCYLCLFSALSFASTSTNASISASISLLPLSFLAFLHLLHYPLPPLRDHLRAVFQKANTRKAIAPTQFNPMSTRGHCIMMVSN